MVSIRAWKRRKWHNLFPHEGVLIERMTPRLHAWTFILRPRLYLRWMHWRFRRWAVLPGDEFWNILTDTHYIVRAVKRDHVIAEAFSGQVWDLLQKGRLALDDPRLVRCYERHERPLSGYWT